MQEETIPGKLDLIVERLDKMQEKKRFKLPLGIRLSKGKLKKNYAVVQLIKLNGRVVFKMVPIEDNTIKIGEVYHDASANYVLRYKKYPMIILPEWNIKPLGENQEGEAEPEPFKPKENMKEAVEEGTLSASEKFILHAIKMDLVSAKAKINMKLLFLIGAVLVGGYFLLDYMKMF